MHRIAPKTTLLDLHHLDNEQVIASCLLESDGGLALVDPGPSSCLLRLREELRSAGVSVADLTALFVTHIHLDHAGAAGGLVRENPKLQVYVHERGAAHLADPSRLLDSARRLYAEDLQRLWGDVLPVPAGNLRVLRGGEQVTLGARGFDVLYTPGHAAHHLTYCDRGSGTAFVGDTAGIRIGTYPLVLPVTPPPDIDLGAWRTSLEQIRRRSPASLFLTHFGPAEGVADHISQLEEKLHSWSVLVRDSLDSPGDDRQRATLFVERITADIAVQLPSAAVARYVLGAGLEMCWYGLARYWRKRAAAA